MEQQKIVSFPDLCDKLKNDLDVIEKQRLESCSVCYKKTAKFSLLVFVLLGGVAFLDSVALTTLTIIGVVVTFAYYIILRGKHARTYRDAYKRDIITKFVNTLIPGGKYEPSNGIPLEIFQICGLFRNPDRYNTEDLISGTIGVTAVSFAEVHAEEKSTSRDSDGNETEHWSDIFRGFIFLADFNKSFKGKTIVTNSKEMGRRKNKVNLEDPLFSKRFHVYSDDQIEARYILTPSMMQRILNLENKFGKGSLKLSFINSEIIIAVKNRWNHFEGNLSRSATDPKNLKREYEVLISFINVVEELNLNRRIWRSEKEA